MEKGMCGKERRWGATIILIHKQEGCLGMTGAACGHGEGVLLFGGRHGPPLPQTERSGEDGERERVDGEGGESVEPEDDRGRLYGGTGGKSPEESACLLPGADIQNVHLDTPDVFRRAGTCRPPGQPLPASPDAPALASPRPGLAMGRRRRLADAPLAASCLARRAR